MKKVILLMVFVLTALAVQAQVSPQAEKIATNDLLVLEKKITRYYPNLKFNENQRQRLTSVLTKRAEEVVALRSIEDLEKIEYHLRYKDIAAKYNNDIEGIMSPEQKTVYLRKVKKQVQKD